MLAVLKSLPTLCSGGVCFKFCFKEPIMADGYFDFEKVLEEAQEKSEPQD